MKRRECLALLLAVVCAGLALSVASTSSPLYATNFWTDSNLYFTIGRGMTGGLMPYRDLFDHKGPLIFMLYAVGALVSDTSFFGVFLLELAGLAAALYLAYRTVALYGEGPLTLLSIPLTAMVTVCATAFNQGGSAEEFCLCALSLALYAALRRMREGARCAHPARLHAAFGAAMGGVFAIKYTDCGLFFGLGLCLLLYELRARGLIRAIASGLWMLAGMAAVVLPVALFLAANGVLGDMIRVYFIQNIFGYGGASMTLVEHLYNALAYLRTQSAANPAVAALAFAGCAFALADALRRHERGALCEALAVPLGAGLLLLFCGRRACAHDAGGEGRAAARAPRAHEAAGGQGAAHPADRAAPPHRGGAACAAVHHLHQRHPARHGAQVPAQPPGDAARRRRGRGQDGALRQRVPSGD